MGVLADWQIKQDVLIRFLAEGERRPGVISYGLTSYGYDCRVGYKFKVFTPVHCTVIDPKAFDPKAFVDVDLTPPIHKWEPKNAKGGIRYFECDSCKMYMSLADYEGGASRGWCEIGRKADHILIPPHSFALGETVEEIEVPRDCLGVVLGKSTYARCGISVPLTPLEPEWKGKVTVEIANTTHLPAKVYCGEGIMQVIFLRADGRAEMRLDHLYDYLGSKDVGLGDLVDSGSCEVSYADKKGRYQDQPGLTLPSVDKG